MSTLPTLEVEQTVRLSCRVSPRIKRQVEEAATYLGQSITDFTEVALKEKAEAVLENAHKIKISERSFEQFEKAINAAKAPTPELAAAMKVYESQRELEPGGAW